VNLSRILLETGRNPPGRLGNRIVDRLARSTRRRCCHAAGGPGPSVRSKNGRSAVEIIHLRFCPGRPQLRTCAEHQAQKRDQAEQRDARPEVRLPDCCRTLAAKAIRCLLRGSSGRARVLPVFGSGRPEFFGAEDAEAPARPCYRQNPGHLVARSLEIRYADAVYAGR
jgi:hypothetical protein